MSDLTNLEDSLPLKERLKRAGFAKQPSLREKMEMAKKIREQEKLLRRAQGQDVIDHKIVVICDDSGSMATESCSYYDVTYGTNLTEDNTPKIEYLRQAIHGFLRAISDETVVGISTFNNTFSSPIDSDFDSKIHSLNRIQPMGRTPIAKSLSRNLDNSDEEMTRAILISDGDADSPKAAISEARNYAKREIPIDCLHIGHSSGGEDTMKQIASITGGLYIKFSSAEAFASALSYLTPQGRDLLLSGNVSRESLGADEILGLPPRRD